MKILMAASESHPLVKTGGLADVVFALAKELNFSGRQVDIVLPYYQIIKRKNLKSLKHIGQFPVAVGWRHQTAQLYETVIEGIRFYLIGNDYYFDRAGVYGFPDEGERFAFFTLAIREMLKFIQLVPDIIHLHDWQAGMLPCLVKEQRDESRFLKQTKFVLTIHNPAFQGMLPPSLLEDFYRLPYYLYENGQVRFKDQVSTLKSAIVYADKITTVSPTHAEELMTPELSYDLSHVIKFRHDDFQGILNGIDTGYWNPETDALIGYRYGKENAAGQKLKNKKALLAYFSLPYKPKTAVFSIVTRLTWQKGIDHIINGLGHLMDKGVYLIILGSGEHVYETRLNALCAQYPSQIGLYIGYEEKLSHLIYAGSDVFLMPSLFEPCGISQMISMRYGTVPVVRLTGGLKDTVRPYSEFHDRALGFGFNDYDTPAYEWAVDQALEIRKRPRLWARIRRNGMEEDVSWKTSAGKYLSLYTSMIK